MKSSREEFLKALPFGISCATFELFNPFVCSLTIQQCCYTLIPYVDFESSQLFHLDGLRMLLNISIACWNFSLVENPIKYKF